MKVTGVKAAATIALILSGNLIFTAALPRPARANIAPTRPGCTNAWAFNGVWRVRVNGFAPHMDGGKQTGWDVTETWRNGSSVQLNGPRDSFERPQELRLHDGSTINVSANTPAVLSQQALDFHVFAPAAQYTHVQLFAANGIDPNDKPESVVISFDTAKLAGTPNVPKFTVNPPNFQIKFTCSPSEMARAIAAQGGSHEVPAHEGCLGQAVSDGNWRVRVTGVELGTDVGQTTPTGWNVAEEWTNSSGRKLSPNGTWLFDQQLVLASGDTMGAGTLAQLGAHDFAPRESSRYTQPFRVFREAFDQSNKPIKLLLTFNAKLYAIFSTPKYSGATPNIRIRLDCVR